MFFLEKHLYACTQAFGDESCAYISPLVLQIYLLDRYICITYTLPMIVSFGDKETEKIYKVPPSNPFELLLGKLKGYCSIRINGQWRIQFKFQSGNAYEVSIVDYH